MHLVAQGFEADGGRGVTAEAAQLVSSMPFLIGYKADGDLEYLSRGGARSVHLIAIDPQAQRRGRRQAGARAPRDALRLGAHASAERHIQIRVAAQGDDAGGAAAGDRCQRLRPAARHRCARQLRVRSARRAGRALGALRLPGRRRRQRHARAGEERRAGAGAVEARLRAGRGNRAIDPRAVRRCRPDHDRARARLRLALVQDHDDELGAAHPVAGRPRRQRLRHRDVRARCRLVRDLHEPAVVRRAAVLDRRRCAPQSESLWSRPRS